MRFQSRHATPPGGVYFFALDGDFVESRSSATICLLVKDLYRKQGRQPPFDPLSVVMTHMCKSMPDGFCTEPTGMTGANVSTIKERTRALFRLPIAEPVVIRERLHVCLACPENSRSVCPACSGLLDWVLSHMSSRTRIPADEFAYVCGPAQVFVSALVTAEDPGPPPDGCPETCWRCYGKRN